MYATHVYFACYMLGYKLGSFFPACTFHNGWVGTAGSGLGVVVVHLEEYQPE